MSPYGKGSVGLGPVRSYPFLELVIMIEWSGADLIIFSDMLHFLS